MVGHRNTIPTTDEFIERARKVHGDKYDYSKVVYKNNRIKVTIICLFHGEFLQTPNDHLDNHGCRLCAGNNLPSNTQEFVIKAKQIHGIKYDYRKVNYKTNRTPVKIICHLHGIFTQKPHEHLRGMGCGKCSNNIVLTNREFILKAIEIHGNKYDYSKVNYLENKSKVVIICRKHGEFYQIPNSHLRGRGCPHCNSSTGEAKISRILERNIFITSTKNPLVLVKILIPNASCVLTSLFLVKIY